LIKFINIIKYNWLEFYQKSICHDYQRARKIFGGSPKLGCGVCRGGQSGFRMVFELRQNFNPENANRKKFEETTTNFFISRGATAQGLEKLAEQMKIGHMNFGRGQSATEVTYHLAGLKTEKVFQQIQKAKILTKEGEMTLPIISLENHFANRRAVDFANGGEYITEEIKKLNEVASMKNGEKKR
jgi:hypothetical protein